MPPSRREATAAFRTPASGTRNAPHIAQWNRLGRSGVTTALSVKRAFPERSAVRELCIVGKSSEAFCFPQPLS
jgi:hypothetical protein